MNDFQIANLYFRTFRSFIPYVKFREFKFILVFFLGFLFFYFSGRVIVRFDGDVLDLDFLFLILAEAAFIVSSMFLSECRDKRVIEALNDRYGWSCDHLDAVKIKLLEFWLKEPVSQFRRLSR